jgi:hypothetical protein
VTANSSAAAAAAGATTVADAGDVCSDVTTAGVIAAGAAAEGREDEVGDCFTGFVSSRTFWDKKYI